MTKCLDDAALFIRGRYCEGNENWCETPTGAQDRVAESHAHCF
jgi:hypothetical protein